MGRKLTGLKAHRSDGRGEYYWLRDVLDHLLARTQDGPNLSEEQALLAEARREKLELETAELRGQLCRVEHVEQLWSEMIANAKNRLRAIPHNTAHQVMAASALSEAMKIIEDAVEESLRELAESGVPSGSSIGHSEEALDATATAHG